MGNAIQVITGRILNQAGLTAWTANTGDSLTVRDFNDATPTYLEGMWGQSATAGTLRVRSARLHDFVQGIRFQLPAALIRNFLPDEASQPLFPNDVLTVEQAGGAAETDSGSLLLYYTDLPGIAARLATWEQIRGRVVNILTAEVAVVGPVTAGDWSPGTNLNTTFDLLKADTDYAVLGYQTATACNAVAISGTDTGNLKAGGPGTTESIETRNWFVEMSKAKNKPYIPIINSNNRGATQAFVALNTAAGTVNVDYVLAQLTR
jgi:hypothetical protein